MGTEAQKHCKRSMSMELYCVGEMFFWDGAYDHLDLVGFGGDKGIVLAHAVEDFACQPAQEKP